MDQHFKKTFSPLLNYDSLNLEQTLFWDNELNIILGNSGQHFLGSLDAVSGTEKNFYIECSDCKVESCRGKGICSSILYRDSRPIAYEDQHFTVRQMHHEVQHLVWYWELRETQKHASI